MLLCVSGLLESAQLSEFSLLIASTQNSSQSNDTNALLIALLAAIIPALGAIVVAIIGGVVQLIIHKKLSLDQISRVTLKAFRTWLRAWVLLIFMIIISIVFLPYSGTQISIAKSGEQKAKQGFILSPQKDGPIILYQGEKVKSIDVLTNDNLSVEFSKKPTNGTVTRGKGIGEINYTPKDKYIGDDSFEYQIHANGKAIAKPVRVILDIRSSGAKLYEDLEKLLSERSWKEADQVSKNIILSALGRSSSASPVIKLDAENVYRVCSDFKKLEKLWNQETESRFGFGVQAEVALQALSEGKDDNAKLRNLNVAFGLQSPSEKETAYIEYDKLRFNFNRATDMKPGYLPAFVAYKMGVKDLESFYRAIEGCLKIQRN